MGPHGVTQLLTWPAPADAPCFVCGGPLDGTTLIELRGFPICEICARVMLGDEAAATKLAVGGTLCRLADEDLTDEVLRAPDGHDNRRDGDDDASRGEGAAPVLSVPGSAIESCSGCGTALLGRGSYQLVAGRPCCAACVIARI